MQKLQKNNTAIDSVFQGLLDYTTQLPLRNRYTSAKICPAKDRAGIKFLKPFFSGFGIEKQLQNYFLHSYLSLNLIWSYIVLR